MVEAADLSQDDTDTKVELSIEEILAPYAIITSSVPGRIRYRLKPEYCKPESINRGKGVVESQPGVEQVLVNYRTGSVLVLYDHRVHRGSAVLEVLKDMEEIAAPIFGLEEMEGDTGDSRPQSERIADAIYDIDVSIYEKTGLRLHGLAIPGALAGFGVYQLATYGLVLETIPGVLLLYIAWDIATKLNAEPTLPERRNRPDEVNKTI